MINALIICTSIVGGSKARPNKISNAFVSNEIRLNTAICLSRSHILYCDFILIKNRRKKITSIANQNDRNQSMNIGLFGVSNVLK